MPTVKSLSHVALETIQKHYPLQQVRQAGYAQLIQNAQKERKQRAQRIIKRAGIDFIKTMDPLYRKVNTDSTVFRSVPRSRSLQLTREPNTSAMIDSDLLHYLETHPYSHRLGFKKMNSTFFPNILYVTYKRGPHLMLSEYQLPEQRLGHTTLEEDIQWVFDQPVEARVLLMKSSGPLLQNHFLDPLYRKLLGDHVHFKRVGHLLPGTGSKTTQKTIDPKILDFFSQHPTSKKIFFQWMTPRTLVAIFCNQKMILSNQYQLPQPFTLPNDVDLFKGFSQTKNFLISSQQFPFRKKVQN